MKLARSLLSHSTSSATSSARPRRPMGWSPTRALRASGGRLFSSGVSMYPGPTAFTRMPFAAYSRAAVCVKLSAV